MMQQPYSYVVLRYMADQGAGEALNVGVVVYSEQARFFAYRIDSHYERLSRTFATFDGVTFRRSVANLLHALRNAERSFSGKPLLVGERSFTDWLSALMPDVGGSLAFSDSRHGIADDLVEEVDALFERMVESQKAGTDESPRRDDVQIWRTYERALKPTISKHLRPKSFATNSV